MTFPSGVPYDFFMDRLWPAFRAELEAFTELESFTEVVAGTRTSPCTIAEAVEVGLVAEAPDLSLREHRPVKVDEVRI